MTDIFDQVGYIINEYVPELYQLDLFKNTHILSIIDTQIKSSIEDFKKYVNLKNLDLKNFNGSLEPLRGIQIKQLWLNRFNGDLQPLTSSQLELVWIPCFDRDLQPLADANANTNANANASIKEICPMNYGKKYIPLKSTPDQKIYIVRYLFEEIELVQKPLICLSLNSGLIEELKCLDIEYNKDLKDIVMLPINRTRTNLLRKSCVNLSKNHNKIIITFHDYNSCDHCSGRFCYNDWKDHNFEKNLELNDVKIEILISRHTMISDKKEESDFFKLKDDNNNYIYPVSIDNIRAGLDIEIPCIESSSGCYFPFSYQNIMIKFLAPDIYDDKIVARIRVE
jgi:hypothetical protein